MQHCEIVLVGTLTGYQVKRVQPGITQYMTDAGRWTKYEDQAFTWANFEGAAAEYVVQCNNPRSNGFRVS
jgi:hypothetical protein